MPIRLQKPAFPSHLFSDVPELRIAPRVADADQTARTRIIPRAGLGFVKPDPENPRIGEYFDFMRLLRFRGKV